jgi:hypothetical protein
VIIQGTLQVALLQRRRIQRHLPIPFILLYYLLLVSQPVSSLQVRLAVSNISHRTYWYYYWTSIAPYTVRTVTSTETTTTTIWSAYATASAEASESFEYYITASLTPPYSATSLKSSTDSVPLSTDSSDTTGAATATAAATTLLHSGGDDTGSSGNGGSSGAAVSRSVGGFVPFIGAIAACIVGGLAFGL